VLASGDLIDESKIEEASSPCRNLQGKLQQQSGHLCSHLTAVTFVLLRKCRATSGHRLTNQVRRATQISHSPILFHLEQFYFFRVELLETPHHDMSDLDQYLDLAREVCTCSFFIFLLASCLELC
jgi:hypothetical protein